MKNSMQMRRKGKNMSKIEELMTTVNMNVFEERLRQNNLWGHQRHSLGAWLAILVEEVGEVAQAMQEGMVSQKETDSDNLYKELIQVAAVASAIAEQVLEERERDLLPKSDSKREELLKRASQFKAVPGHGPNLNKLTDEQLELRVQIMEFMFKEAFEDEEEEDDLSGL
jgi:NTP pyrophosphatase (non-canonical NTP hydrolase)